MAIPSIFLNFLFPPPPSLFVTTMSVIGISSLANAGFMEIKGKHMQYSKFLNEGVAKKENGAKLSSRNGMLLAYTPAFVVGLSSLLAFPDQDLRFLLLASSLTVHFLKRVLEVKVCIFICIQKGPSRVSHMRLGLWVIKTIGSS
ncbi:putative 3-oxo-5-alpha-steroid 4-dehydrogenase/very-long-chain enoyl-CoA reductase [Helianthus annuus]|nr:putative 3-oxo-5-alpha-steroid 4-dehydrogenase/very-long-chain enoyl-CoA reductase [Helianthus annuus]